MHHNYKMFTYDIIHHPYSARPLFPFFIVAAKKFPDIVVYQHRVMEFVAHSIDSIFSEEYTIYAHSKP